jgi:hypothetical protein
MTSSVIDPTNVVILMNSSDPESLILAESYRSVRHIPEKNIVICALGKDRNLKSEAKIVEVQKKVLAKGKDYLILAFRTPLVYNELLSITTALSIQPSGEQVISAFIIQNLDEIGSSKGLGAIDVTTWETVVYPNSEEPAIISWWKEEQDPGKVLFMGDGLCSQVG